MSDASPHRSEPPGFLRRLAAAVLGRAAAAGPSVKRAAGYARLAVFLLFVGVIGWRLNALGVDNVIAALPTSPWFYVLFLLAYFSAPAFEMLIYGPLWRAPLLSLARVLIQKRILNEGVLGYSGEAFLGWWARTRLKIPGARVFAAIKDSNFVSSFVSTTATLGMAYVVMLSGAGARQQGPLVSHHTQIYSVLGAVTGVVVLLYLFRRRLKLISMDAETVVRISRVHALRLTLFLGLQLMMWTIAAPGVPFMGWVVLLAAYLMVTRLPFMPNYDLVLLGLGLSLSSTMGASEHAVAGLFLANAGLSQAMNLTLMLLLGRPRIPVPATVAETSGGEASLREAA